MAVIFENEQNYLSTDMPTVINDFSNLSVTNNHNVGFNYFLKYCGTLYSSFKTTSY